MLNLKKLHRSLRHKYYHNGMHSTILPAQIRIPLTDESQLEIYLE